MNIRNPSWCKVILVWLALLMSVIIVSAHLASGYSWTLPGIGVVPGPPSPFWNVTYGIAFITCLVGVIVAAIPVLVSGTTAKRIVVGIPVLAVFLFATALAYSALY